LLRSSLIHETYRSVAVLILVLLADRLALLLPLLPFLLTLLLGLLSLLLALLLLLLLALLLIWFFLFYRRYYDVIWEDPRVIGNDKVHRKSEYKFKVEGYLGPVSYRVGDDDDAPWKPLLPNKDGEYVIPKGEAVDDITIEIR